METVLGRLEGVVAADADFRTGRAVVTYDPAQTSPEQIVEAFNGQTFYRARVAGGESSAANVGTVVLSIPDLRDQTAAQRVTQALQPFQGAIRGGSLEVGRITIEYDPTQVKAEQLVEAIRQGTSYQVTLESLTGPEAQPSGSSGVADLIYTAIGYGKYVLWGLLGLGILWLSWRVIGRRLVRVQVHSTGK